MSHCSIVAELSANHDGSIQRAKDIISAAAHAGADAVKIQTYTADAMTIDCDNEYFTLRDGLWVGRTLYDLYSEAYTPWEWHTELQAHALACGLEFFSTPFDATAVDFLESLDMSCYKIASFELVDIPLLKKVASTSKPVILSTGMASIAEIEEAVTTLRDSGAGEITLLKCTSAYPASPTEANLATMADMRERFGCRVGLSDHTEGSAVAVAAVALGAVLIEKHFTLDKGAGGPDDSFSMEPDEFTRMVADIRIVEQALGAVNYELTEGQKASLCFRRSLFAVKDIAVGEPFTTENVRCIRPGHGLHPRYLDELMGKCSGRTISCGEPISLEDLCHTQ